MIEYGTFAEYAGLKRQLIGGLKGRVLELGVGKGANADMLPRGIDWVGVEPSRRRRRQLADGRVLNATAEDIPLADASVDAVLATIVLCSVDSQERALREVVRVLRPGGRFVFFEHVAAPRDTWRYRGEKIIAPLNRVLDRGCDPSRESWKALEAAAFAHLDLRWFRRGGPRSTRLIAGVATR